MERVDDQPTSLQHEDVPELKECPECNRLDHLLFESLRSVPEGESASILEQIRLHLTANPPQCAKLTRDG